MTHFDLTAWATFGMLLLTAAGMYGGVMRTVNKDREERADRHRDERQKAFEDGAREGRRQADVIIDGLRQTIQSGEISRAELVREIQYLKERIDDLGDQLRGKHG